MMSSDRIFSRNSAYPAAESRDTERKYFHVISQLSVHSTWEPIISDIILEAAPGDSTTRLQAAIDRGSAAGRRLILAAGIHETAGLRLPSGTDLHLAKGAILRPFGDYGAYAATRCDVIAESSDRAMLVAKHGQGIRLTGEGIIEAPGAAFIAGDLFELGTHLPAAHRPRVFAFDRCAGIEIGGISIVRSPMWTVHLIGCSDVTITGITIDNDRRMPNTDGIVVDACNNVDIRACRIATADDGIVLKTSRRMSGEPAGECRNIRVSRSIVESRSCALKIGTETWSNIENVAFFDCDVAASNRALGIFSRDGGTISNVAFRRIQVDCHETPDGFWGAGEAITVNVVDRRRGHPAGPVRNVLFEDITGAMEGAVNLIADGRAGISGMRLRRIRLSQRPGALGTGQAYDLRPTRFDLAPPPATAGRANAFVMDDGGSVIGLVAYPGGLPGLFASNVENLACNDIRIERPLPLPAGWNARERVIVEGEPQRW